MTRLRTRREPDRKCSVLFSDCSLLTLRVSFLHRANEVEEENPTFFFCLRSLFSLSTHAERERERSVTTIQTPEKQPRPHGKEAAPPLSPGLPFFLSVVAGAASSLTGGMATAMDLGGAEAPAAAGAGVSGDDSLYPIAILM